MQTDRRKRLKIEHMERLEKLKRLSGMELYAIANKIGLSPSTLYNIAKPNLPNIASTNTLSKLDEFEASLQATTNGSGFREPEAVRLDPDQVTKDLRPCHPGQSVWRIETRAVELPPYGLQPGMQVLIDDRVQPSRIQPYDVVCANTATGETVWRVFVPPYYLLTASADKTIPASPLIVGHDAAIMGTVVKAVFCRAESN